MKPAPGYDTFSILIKKVVKIIEDEGYYVWAHDQTSVGDYIRVGDHKRQSSTSPYDFVYVDMDTEKIYCSGTIVHLQNKLNEVTND